MESLPPLGAHASRAPIDRLGVTVIRALVDMLVTGAIAEHEHLPPEQALCDSFGVSRTVVRESIKRLQEKGMVTVAQGRGTVVNPSRQWNVLDPLVLETLIAHDESLGILDDLSTSRAALEAAMAADVARLQEPDSIARIGETLEAMRLLVRDQAAFDDADVRFHHAVMDASGNRIGSTIARRLFDTARTSLRFDGALPANAAELTLREHEAVFAAIRTADALLASRAMQSHILGAWGRRRLPSVSHPTWTAPG